MPNSPVIWISSELHRMCADEASGFFDLETGGTFMGYWPNAETAVITGLIGAGPNALHERHNFEPDQEWQLKEIASHYETSGRRETYIGDWHSHPNAQSGRLSWTDRGVLRQIIKTPEARASRPIMVVFHGVPNDWQTTAWIGDLRERRLLWPKLEVCEATLQLYDPVSRDC